MNEIAHEGTDFTAQELLAALVAERLEQLVNRLVDRGAFRLGYFGSRRHAEWLDRNIDGMAGVPMDLYISWGDPDLPVGSTYKDVPVVDIDDPSIDDSVDAVLIADDRHEKVLFEIARRKLSPHMLIHTLYDRLPIGRTPLPARIATSASFEPKTPSIVTAPAAPLSSETATGIAALVAGTAVPN